MTLFSIVIPCHNAAATLPQTLGAVLAQTDRSWEAICIDDGSTDKTRAILDQYAAQDPRIHVVAAKGDGPSRARNTAVFEQAKGEVIAFCDADDIWTPRKLAELSKGFRDPSVDAIYGKIAFFSEQPSDSKTVSIVPKGRLTVPMLLAENPVCTMSNIAIRTSSFRQSGGFNEDMVHNEDLDWLIRLVGGGANLIGLNSLQTYYRASQYGLSSDLSAMFAGRQAAIETAKTFGHVPAPSANAVYYRYLARRALRLGGGRLQALRFAMLGLCASPRGFFTSPKRGLLTLLAACGVVVLPTRMSRVLFS